MARPRRQGGFTLVEVLVALTIVAIALGAGLRAASSLADNSERLGLVTAAQWCADNELVRVRLSRQFPPVGDSEFICQQAGWTLSGRLNVRPTPNPNFRRLEATVWDNRPQGPVALYTLNGIAANQ